MKKEGIQTRKRKPKPQGSSGSGGGNPAGPVSISNEAAMVVMSQQNPIMVNSVNSHNKHSKSAKSSSKKAAKAAAAAAAAAAASNQGNISSIELSGTMIPSGNNLPSMYSSFTTDPNGLRNMTNEE